MPKDTINFKKVLCTWFIWTIVYFCLMDIFCCSFLDFSPLSSDWAIRIGNFLNDRWVIVTGKDWLLLLIIVAFWPVYFVGWHRAYRFDWKRIMPRCFRKKAIVSRPSDPDTTKKSFGPQKLRVQTSALLSVKAADAQTPIAGPMGGGGDMGAVPPMNQPSPVSNRPPLPQYEDETEVQQMLAQTAGVQADFFPHVLLDGKYASFAMSTEKLAAVIRIINRPESTFAVDTEVDINSSDWFYESGLIQTPAKDIIAISQNLQANEPDSVATPVILLMGGQLLNVEETLAYFEKNNVMLLRTENVDINEIPLVMDFMHDYFGMKSEGA